MCANRLRAEPSKTRSISRRSRLVLAVSRLTFADQTELREASSRSTSPFSCISLSIVATVVVATGRLRRKAAQTCFSSDGPCSQSAFKISNSPSVGWERACLAIAANPFSHTTLDLPSALLEFYRIRITGQEVSDIGLIPALTAWVFREACPPSRPPRAGHRRGHGNGLPPRGDTRRGSCRHRRV